MTGTVGKWTGAVTALTAGAGALVAYAPPAQAANTLYPSGCQNWAYGLTWQPNCYVGANYINSGSGYVLGIMYFVGECSPGCGGNGNWTATEQYNTKMYQQAHFGSYDGIVGPQTWTEFGGEIWFCSSNSSYYFYARNSAYCNTEEARFLNRVASGPYQYKWYVHDQFQSATYYTFGDGMAGL